MQEVEQLMDEMTMPSTDAMNSLRAILAKRIEKARCLSNSCLAAEASGNQGY